MPIWSRTPAENWESYYPLGSGRLGAMISGNTLENEIVLNDDRLFSASRCHRVNAAAKAHFSKVQELLFADKIIEAEQLAATTMFSTPANPANYEPLGLLKIRDRSGDSFSQSTAYRRELDLTRAIYSEDYSGRSDGYHFEAFTGLADHTLYGHYVATQSVLDLDFVLTRQEERYESVCQLDPYTILLAGHAAGRHSRRFAIKLSLYTEDGTLTVWGNTITILGARQCWFRVTGDVVTDDDDFSFSFTKNEPLTAITYADIRERNISAYQRLFQRTDFQLTDDPMLAQLPTAERITRLKNGIETDPGLITLLFDYGKYLIIASSGPRTSAANLQGIWNKDLIPRWGSRYTVNINTEMNYWLTGPLNLDELTEPLVDLFLTAVTHGRDTANAMYSMPGSVIHHNLDIYGDGAPQSTTMSASQWPMGGVWLANELWRHYQFNHDAHLLARIFPAFKELDQFFDAFLTKDPDGYLGVAPSMSPENYYLADDHYIASLSYSTTIDNSLLREFYGALIHITLLLNQDTDQIPRWRDTIAQLRPTTIAASGRIQEYVHDYPEVDPGHRHFSPLYGLFPGDEFTTPALKRAAHQLLTYRLQHGSGQTGWSLAWMINLFARLGDGEAAWQAVNRMFTQSTQDNLLNSHPPFQIDGNLGFSNAIAEMIVQSNATTISLLPALPKAWTTGHLFGVRTRTGVILDLTWRDCRLTALKIHGKLAEGVTIHVDPRYIDSRQPDPLKAAGYIH
ncbi:glycosyl hydrolase family 95 catalytic domain-containing protein [Schleiferilactobacillus perolens]|uniref:Uncharacterized protein n=1 Tax=Schleiferilactobacillus perolens DSM 12744 TaxID=1423792 RepID=A0A0R1N9M3_9LACO|nr:glycoside hydrolase N-terminal domain-containing protein [Schleiferilactobacillus perolens]KRL14402.1 hypothetical protein FD09_GL000049 [Schleiferilactobacillus perolens DSM 12744]